LIHTELSSDILQNLSNTVALQTPCSIL